MKVKNKRLPNFDLIRTTVAISLAMIIAIIIIFLVSKEPTLAMYKFLLGPVSNARYFGDVIELMTPLLFTGLAVSIMFQTRIFNLATEGMFYAGGLVAAVVATLVKLPLGIHPLVGLAAGILAGAFIAYIPSILKIKFGANEVVSSLMLNYVIFKFGDYTLKTFLKDPKVTHVTSYKFAKTSLLPKLFGDIHIGLVIAILLLVGGYIFLYNTRWGYAIRITGQNNNFAKYSGINVTRTIIMSQLIGGMVAGLGGAAHMLGTESRFNWEWRSGYGWDGLMIAIIARYNPKLIPAGALILAYLRIGSDIMSRTTDVQNEVVAIIQGIIIVLIASKGFLGRYEKKLIVKYATESAVVKGVK